jgi:hypothetical protein
MHIECNATAIKHYMQCINALKAFGSTLLPTTNRKSRSQKPEVFYAVGQFYDDFSQTTDEEVAAALSSG